MNHAINLSRPSLLLLLKSTCPFPCPWFLNRRKRQRIGRDEDRNNNKNYRRRRRKKNKKRILGKRGKQQQQQQHKLTKQHCIGVRSNNNDKKTERVELRGEGRWRRERERKRKKQHKNTEIREKRERKPYRSLLFSCYHVSIVWRCASVTQQTVATARRGASIIPQQPTSVHPSDTLLARTPSSTPFFSYSVTLDFLFFLRGKKKTTTDISSAENKIEPGLINAAATDSIVYTVMYGWMLLPCFNWMWCHLIFRKETKIKHPSVGHWRSSTS